MADEKIYVHIKVDLDNDFIIFNNDTPMNIGQYLLDFIYFDFEADENSVQNRYLHLHPYFRLLDQSRWDLSQIKKLQNIYKAYFDRQVSKSDDPEENFAKNSEDILYFSKYNCIAGVKLCTEGPNKYARYLVMALEDCLYIEWLEMTRRKLLVKLCKNCHRYFVPKKGNIDYCQRRFTDDEKTCAQVGYAQTFAKNVKNDELLQAYTRAYKAHYARMTKPRKRAANMTKEAFEAWYTEAKNYLALARQGKIEVSDYLEWLKK